MLLLVLMDSSCAVDGPLSDQIQAMRSITSLTAEMSSKVPTDDGPLLQTLLAKGPYFRVLERPGPGWKLPEDKPSANVILSQTVMGESVLLDGILHICRRDPLDGAIKGPRPNQSALITTIILLPFEFLELDPLGSPGSGTICWSDLWDDAKLSMRIQKYITSQQDDGTGGVWLTVPLTCMVPGEAGSVDTKDLGGCYKVHVATTPGVTTTRVVTEIQYFSTSGLTAPNGITTFAYQVVRDGLHEIPVLSHAACTASGTDAATTSYDVVSVACGVTIDDHSLEIDPAFANRIVDRSKGVTIAPGH